MSPKRTLHPEGLKIIKKSEALRLFAYPDPNSPLAKATRSMTEIRWGFVPARQLLKRLEAVSTTAPLVRLSGAPWTCGYGHTRGVNPDTTCTEALAEQWLDDDADEAQDAVEELVEVYVSDLEYAALVSLVFNIGRGNFAKSTLLKTLNKGDHVGAAARFVDFNKAMDQETKKLVVLPGLTIRRGEEQSLFLRGRTSDHTELASSQAVEDTPDRAKDATKDPGLTIPVGTGIVTAGAVLSDTAQKLEPLSAYSETIKQIFVILTVIGIAVTIWYQYRRRSK